MQDQLLVITIRCSSSLLLLGASPIHSNFNGFSTINSSYCTAISAASWVLPLVWSCFSAFHLTLVRCFDESQLLLVPLDKQLFSFRNCCLINFCSSSSKHDPPFFSLSTTSLKISSGVLSDKHQTWQIWIGYSTADGLFLQFYRFQLNPIFHSFLAILLALNYQ